MWRSKGRGKRPGRWVSSPRGDNLQKSSTTGKIAARVEAMKYWISTFQMTGVALFVGAMVADEPTLMGVAWGIWLIILGYLFTLLGGKE